MMLWVLLPIRSSDTTTEDELEGSKADAINLQPEELSIRHCSL